MTCGLGKRLRERFCDSPVPSNGGAPCNESERTEQEHCRLQKCIKPGKSRLITCEILFPMLLTSLLTKGKRTKVYCDYYCRDVVAGKP